MVIKASAYLKQRGLQFAIASSVLVTHGVAMWLFAGAKVSSPHGATPAEYIVVNVPPTDRHGISVVALPEMHLSNPIADSKAITLVRFVDPDSGVVKGITAPASAPQLDPALTADSVRYALQAGLAIGEAVTVVVGIEVLADGSVGQVTIVSGSGNASVDAAAMEYAHALRWIPGTVERRARVMRINFPVTLSVPG